MQNRIQAGQPYVVPGPLIFGIRFIATAPGATWQVNGGETLPIVALGRYYPPHDQPWTKVNLQAGYSPLDFEWISSPADRLGEADGDQLPLDAAVLFDQVLTNQPGQYNGPILPCGQYPYVKQEFQLTAASGGATNTVAIVLTDILLNGSAASVYAQGSTALYNNPIALAAPFASNAFTGVPYNSAAPAGNQSAQNLVATCRSQFVQPSIFPSGNTTQWSGRMRVLGFS